MKFVGFLIFLALAVLAVRGARWAFVAFSLMIPLSFFAFTGFRPSPKPCELTFDLPLAIQSLTNYGHIILFAFYFLVTTRHYRLSRWFSWGWSAGLTMAVGAAMEVAQAVSGIHHCKTVDLIPDFVGVLIGLVVVTLAGHIAQARRRRLPRGITI